MTHEVSMTEMSRHFSEYLNRVTYRGEHFLVRRGKKILAELRPSARGRRLGELPALFTALPRLGAEQAALWAKELRNAKKALGRRRERDPWAS